MKGMFKRALAGVAAAALAATGLMLGTGAANAAPTGSASITLTGATAAGTTYTAYKIGSYNTSEGAYAVNVDDPTKLDSIVVSTDDGWDEDALAALKTATGNQNIENDQEFKGYGSDPLAYVAGKPLNATQMEAFVAELSKGTVLADKTDSMVSPVEQITQDGAPVVFDNIAEGLYLVVSNLTNDAGQSAGEPIAIIGTTVTISEKTYKSLGDTELGEAVVKPSTPQKPDKSHPVMENYYVGQSIPFTVTGTIPQYVGDTFSFKDTPSTGLTVETTKENITVSVEGVEDFTVDDWTLTTDPADQTEIVGNNSNSFTISINDPSQYAGKKVTIKYNGVVNNDANGKVVSNKVEFPGTGQFDNDEFETKTETNTIEFTKKGVDEDIDALEGVTFTITASEDNLVPLPEGYNSEATSDRDGKVTFTNLPNGTYTIAEKTPAGGYMNTNTSFTVTVENGKITDFKGDSLDLATYKDGAITVKNVKLITQLPLTGAAGTALFTVLGLLIAGAGALAYMKSRNVKHALRG